MQIQSTIRINKINQQNLKPMQQLASGKSQIAWSPESDKQVPLAGHKECVGLSKSPYLQTFSFAQKNSRQSLIHKEYLTLAKQGCDLVGQCVPGLLDKPIDGIQFIIASSKAFDAWTDPKRNIAVTSLTTGKALVKAFDLIEPYFPALQHYTQHKQAAGLLLSIADNVFVLQKQN